MFWAIESPNVCSARLRRRCSVPCGSQSMP